MRNHLVSVNFWPLRFTASSRASSAIRCSRSLRASWAAPNAGSEMCSHCAQDHSSHLIALPVPGIATHSAITPPVRVPLEALTETRVAIPRESARPDNPASAYVYESFEHRLLRGAKRDPTMFIRPSSGFPHIMKQRCETNTQPRRALASDCDRVSKNIFVAVNRILFKSWRGKFRQVLLAQPESTRCQRPSLGSSSIGTALN